MEAMLSALTLLCLLLTGADAVTVTIPQTTYEVALGKSVTVPCSYKTTVTAVSQLVLLEWSDFTDQNDENPVVTYYVFDKSNDTAPNYQGRLSLNMNINVPTGNFDLTLSSVTMNDNKTFKCHVQAKTDTTKSYATTRVLVLVPPSQPVVGIQGKAEYGQNINLTCLSKDGSPPPTYKWQSYDVQNNPRPFDPKTTDQGGILSLYNISKDTSGYFICTSTNKMGSATSNLTLAVLPPSMNVGSTAGIVAGVAIALLILAILIYCCCCRKKKDKGEEYAMGVHEDEYHDKEDAKKAERHPDGQEEVRTSENTYVNSAPDRRDEYEERSERGNDRRRDYDDRRSDYDDRRSDYDDRRSDYDDRRSDYDDRRSDYNDRRSDYDDRRSDYSDRRDRYNDRNERYNDNRRYDDDRRNDRRDRRNDDDRYDETRDDRSRDKPAVPSNKPPRRN